ncbi:uncharacterized protein PITG_08053 [Phytophthora infestans T30-4]|uniref:Uncharacterized protein n=1 Tax=Phytophthora infestans (strain T30-4) TaxID=403677 RepID=D0N9D2_PHYIT|nr:uncharacterized protein PITG_08053 [Phytophthora infestans T30-4]EEY54420.1 conserved hypothetical protein [Phytophthora infestans T30-4]|eukprot:XP_002904242.1 conserved hypothetical protein [Phytophthora infestans T30-4]
MQRKTLVNMFMLVYLTTVKVECMKLVLYSTRGVTREFNIDAAVQRCYNIYDCFKGPSVSATWNGAKSHTNVVFYSNANCQEDKAVGKGTPEGALYFSDAKFTQTVAAFMIWESGQYATGGIEDACYLDEHSAMNATIIL